ncbi:MAG TPA: N-6 DNA methylase [Vicinamibacterales bacterium]|nr:N-6 DNA methylase [Vicinamibacterales bacterium]
MTSRLDGIGGTLFPGRYLEDAMIGDLPGRVACEDVEPARRRMARWWATVERGCGPATGLRTLFDVVAMPLAGMLGFRATNVRFDVSAATGRLVTRRGTPVALLVQTWARRQPATWREVWLLATSLQAPWCLLVAPPHVSIVDARSRATRRSVDFTMPDVLAPESFARFWRLAHASAFDAGLEERAGTSGAGTSTLDRLVACATAHQDAVGADLQRGVAEALGALAPVVINVVNVVKDPRRLSERRRGSFDEALTIVYRILFLLFAESRALVPHTHPIYAGSYSMASLCREAVARSEVPGLWDALAAITRLSRRGCDIDDLVVAPFNGRLFARLSAPSLERPDATRRAHSGDARDGAVRRALVSLGTRTGRGGRETISYADLGVEELGTVYERVLDLDPAAAPASDARLGAGRRPARGHSTRRKESGTFYTPRPLTEFVVRRTLEPLVHGRSAAGILALRVVDPAMGSGAFLVAACRYLASAYERALVDEGQLGEVDLDAEARADIRRLVAERCLAGVDANPVAVELARLSIWLTTLARGKPLGFLDHRLRTGNSLLGASPADLSRFSTSRRPGAGGARLPLFDDDMLADTIARAGRPLLELLTRRDDHVDDVRAKERLWRDMTGSDGPLTRWRDGCTLWCSQWLWPATASRPCPSPAELRTALDALLRADGTLPGRTLEAWLETARAVEATHRLFHWPLEFPDVFHEADGLPREQPGFDAVIGNPPWEMLRRDPAAQSSGQPTNERGVAFLRRSGVYRISHRGHLNLYQPFVERALGLARRGGRVGLVLPWGFASDDGAADLRHEIVERHGLETVVGLDNGAGLFPVHRGLRFLVAVVRAGVPVPVIRARFGVRTAAELADLPGRDDDPAASAYPVRLTAADLSTIGGARRRLPDARRAGDLALAGRLMRQWPALGSPAGWHVHFGRELNATDDRGLFRPAGLPVLEGKHIRPFGVDTAGVSQFVDRRDAERALGDRINRPRLSYRDVSGVANRLSLIAAVVPAGTVTTHTLVCLREPLAIEQQHFLCALFNSWVLNAIVRLLMGQHVTTGLVEDLPVPRWTGGDDQQAVLGLGRVLAGGGPDVEHEARLQASVAALYGLEADALAEIASGFPLVDAALRQRAVEILRSTPVGL